MSAFVMNDFAASALDSVEARSAALAAKLRLRLKSTTVPGAERRELKLIEFELKSVLTIAMIDSSMFG